MTLKYTLIFLFASFINQALALNIGFNQAWFKNHYSSQYLDSNFDADEVERIFKLTKAAGSQTIRLWFFESSSFPMIDFEQEKMIGLKDEFIKNVITTIRLAKFYDIKIYMTIFDAHTYRPDQLSRTELRNFRKLFQTAGMKNFLERVMTPLLRAIEKENLSQSISKIDLINEGDTVINRGGFDGGWNGMSSMLCQWKSFLSQFRDFYKTPITMSIRLHPLLVLPLNLLQENGPMRCADIIDFHSYDNDGDIYRCSYLQKYSKLQKKKLILGEFGQNYFTHRYSDSLQIKNTQNFILNASRCGFSEALAWRLSDIRDGANPEARYSFEAFGKMRPAYYFIQKNNNNGHDL